MEGTDLPPLSPIPKNPQPTGGKKPRDKKSRFGPKGDERHGPSLASQDKTSILLGEAEFGRRKSGMNRPFRDWAKKESSVPALPSLSKGVLRIVPLGGCSEPGKMMTVIEFGSDIVIVDMGLQWPDRGEHGIDYTIPNATYLHGREDKVRAVVLTNGTAEHIGALPHLMPGLGMKVPVYALPMTAVLALKQQEAFTEKLNIQTVRAGDSIPCGGLTVELVHVNSNIPDSVSVAVTSPAGTVFCAGSMKIDHAPVHEMPIDLGQIRRIGDRGVLALLADAVSSGLTGYQHSEQSTLKVIESAFTQAKGRLIITMASTLVWRAQHVLTLAARYGRAVVVEHDGLRSAIAAAEKLGHIGVPHGVLIDAAEAAKRPPASLVILTTGLDGEHDCGLKRIVAGTHPTIRFTEGDVIAFGPSSAAVGGTVTMANGRAIERLMDAVYRSGARTSVVRALDLHTGSHMKAEELKVLLQLLRPRVFIPQKGSHTQRVLAAQTARQVGFEPGHTTHVLHDGQALEFLPDGTWTVRKEEAASERVAVDGLGVGDVGESVMKDREAMSEYGVFLAVLRLGKSGELKGAPEIISHGFVHLHDSGQLLSAASAFITKVCSAHAALAKSDQKEFKFLLQRELEKFLFQKTERQPMVIPLLVGA